MQNAPSYILGIALVVLLLLIAFSSGTEVAMLSANRYKIRAAAKAGKRTAKALDALLSKPESWLGANLVLLALASVAASSIATLLAQRTGYEHAIPSRRRARRLHDRVLRAGAEDLRGAQARSRGAVVHLHLQGAGLVMDADQLVHQQGGVRFLRLFGVKP
jgi:hypothetical protein